ncbi:alpha/beta fold hydrolase [Sinosporangium siamense]|uniref:Hydrolase n=1 Tax=Sinosporangium siamense TaxID=1367973 RepID=A0A919RMT3_9ACTN|nr:alpha/beta fold hydrolase [Sinosporangium siamense]GII96667.1 hydrolase [Sinosporangium siamense]
MLKNEEIYARSGSLRIWSQGFGDPAHPAIVLVMGTAAQGIGWPGEMVEVLVGRGYRVISFDHRDTGLSDSVDYSAHPYTLDDMAADTLTVMDAHGVSSAHVVGASLGGAIVQLLAVHHPERVRTLTAIMTSPMGHDAGPGWARAMAGQEPDPHTLPAPTTSFLRRLIELATAPHGTREEGVAVAVETWRLTHGDAPGFDEQAARAHSELAHDRAHNPGAAAQHDLAGRQMTDARRVPLSHISAPTLVIHGAADPLLPPAHGRAVAEAVPGARLRLIEGMGHGFFKTGLPTQLAKLIANHAAGERP